MLKRWRLVVSSCMSTRFLNLALLVFAATALAQHQPAAVVVPELQSNSLAEGLSLLTRQAPDLKLAPKEPGGRTGRLWIRNVGTALLIVGQVDGDAPQFPKTKNEVLAGDHVEVWLAPVTEVLLPPIGWGNQFGEQLLPHGPDSCTQWVKEQEKDPETEKTCRTWAIQQQQYRVAFKKLFVRQWLLTPDYSTEAFSTPAFDLILAKYAAGKKTSKAQDLEALKPKGKVQMRFAPRSDGPGYNFQIQIPYTAFPPLNTLDLHSLWLMVDVFSPAPQGRKMGPYSSSSQLRAFAKPETFNRLELQPSRRFHLSPCDVALESADKYGEKHAGWFVPQHDQTSQFEAESFILVNEAQGYAYDPSGLSPVARTVHHFWRKLGDDEWVCGPQLAYRNAGKSQVYGSPVDEEGFDARRLSDGTVLVKSGPQVFYSEFGSGECGACPHYSLDILALDKSLKLQKALSLGGVVRGDSDAVDFSISPDWLKIVQYKEQPVSPNSDQTTWTATSYCFKGVEYIKCGEQKNIQPPDPPLLKELR
jgi:hypothetical protein